MFNPVDASKEIKNSYIDYITTTFDIADKEYKHLLRNELMKDNSVAKGPYIDIGGSFETGHSLRELADKGVVSKKFLLLEPVDEKDRELKLDRTLFKHQEEALKQASTGKNIVVTTGTGSGKTESFLLPIINHLLHEEENETLSHGVRAIIIYPMNALANDQMKRLRKIFKNYPKVCYGVYNGNTRHSQNDALKDYICTYGSKPNPNEIISREVMQKTPPHILITNYSMLEYMMLRPKDDAVFSGAKLKFIVLDEAHIYRGATGMETSILMRRLRARISEPNSVQYILTSATLGGEDANEEIVSFAKNLCGVDFRKENIIRSTQKSPKMIEMRDFPPELFEELNSPESEHKTAEILKKYNADFAPEKNDGEKLYELFLHAKLFDALRTSAKEPVTVRRLKEDLSKVCPAMTDKQIVDFIAVCANAEKDKASLIKPRYHFFVRALEGAYITLGTPARQKRLFLQRKAFTQKPDGSLDSTVFEAAVCSDCGRLAIVGKEQNGTLVQFPRKWANDKSDYYCLTKENDDEGDGENSYVVCAVCGAIAPQKDAELDDSSSERHFCSHDRSNWIKVKKAEKDDTETSRNKSKKYKQCKCPVCEYGKLSRFYLGSEAATAVLGTELFEQLPTECVKYVETKPNLFNPKPVPRKEKNALIPQFLCFSDSRSEAAYFASYMERSYREFLRRRGIWHIAQKYRDEGKETVSVEDFVDRLSRYFGNEKSFEKFENGIKSAGDEENKRQAWIALLNEMYNARRSTSLVSMGIVSFEFSGDDSGVIGYFEKEYKLKTTEAKALFQLLLRDVVLSGAISPGENVNLNDAEREYIFFSPTQKTVTKRKTETESKNGSISGWCGRKSKNGNYRQNNRMTRLIRDLEISPDAANELLESYWEEMIKKNSLGKSESGYFLSANDFCIKIGGTKDVSFYRCKKCGRVTPFNVKGNCAYVKCDGKLERYCPFKECENNHYARLYESKRMTPLLIKEHTAQLDKDQQTKYQKAFAEKEINALSCSTTFEMGVDLGDLETVYMRDVPPTPANYVQRAGRAGRGKQSAAFVLTYAKLSSHDFTYYKNPSAMISGKIKAPVFSIENEKILNRHIFAVALSSFFAVNEDVYDGDNATVFLNEGGYERFKEYLSQKPADLRDLLIKSIPQNMHERLKINDFGWVERLCGEDGVLETAVMNFQSPIEEMNKEIKALTKRNKIEEAGGIAKKLRYYRRGKDDDTGKRSLIDFLTRSNVLPKYGFPVDTVELLPNFDAAYSTGGVQLARDLQLAIAEYAPGAQVVADGKMYVSRYIRKSLGKNAGIGWETGYYCEKCPTCGQPNFTKEEINGAGRECVSCKNVIGKLHWAKTLEPRMGFCADNEVKPVPMHRPEHDYKTEDYYIGDPLRHLIRTKTFNVNGQRLQIESTSNDSLVVIGKTRYNVCPFCGYADVANGKGLKSHKNSRGYDCIFTGKETKKYFLSHDFKTDVAKITFDTIEATDKDRMLSVLYALLEGLSQEMGIERTDIKGCLFRTDKRIYTVVLYDAVAGGAGHVRRIVTEDGKAFQRVLKKSLKVVKDCVCDSSCYQCLRNYYNQAVHENLDRKSAAEFIDKWIGNINPLDDEIA